jgi:hypothetical protein
VFIKVIFFTSTFFNTLKTLVQKSWNDYSFIILKYFIINILNDNNHKNNRQQLIDFVNGFKLKSQFKNKHNKSWISIGAHMDKYIWQWMQIGSIRSILAIFSQTNLYNIQTIKHTSNL